MNLREFIDEYIMADPEWRVAYEEADATREAARALARARHAAGLTQEELARRSGTAQAVISRIERGVVSPSLETLTKIARGLGMRPVVVFEPLRGRRSPAIAKARKTRARPSKKMSGSGARARTSAGGQTKA